MSVNTQSDTVRSKEYSLAVKEMKVFNDRLWSDEKAVFNAVYTEFNPFIPNWKKAGKKDMAKGIKTAVKSVRSQFKEGNWVIMDGNLKSL